MKSNFGRKSLKAVEWVWLVISILSLETIFSQWDENREKAYFFVIFFLLVIFMFKLRRTQRKKMEARWRSNKNEIDN
jgi:DMSO/TMAO reductase YedYZ heme-binding membrane subunit